MSFTKQWQDLTRIRSFEREDDIANRMRKGIKYAKPVKITLDSVEREALKHPTTIKRTTVHDWTMPKQHKLIVTSESGYSLTLFEGFKTDCQARQAYLESAIRNLKVRRPSQELMGSIVMIMLMGHEYELTIQ